MEETVIVIMLKDKKTGFLEKELGCYTIDKNEELIYNTYALEEDGRYTVYIRLTCDKDVNDWEYNAIFDYYDTETFLPFVSSIEEEEDCYNPTWKISFDFLESQEEMEDKIRMLLSLHKQELDSVYEAIADKRDDYKDYDE